MKNCEPVTLVVIAPIPHQERPNFDFSCKKGLHTCWHMHKRPTWHRPYCRRYPNEYTNHFDFSADSKTIINLGNYLVQAIGWMGQSPWDVAREARS